MHILIIKTSALGDILHTYPALSYLRQLFPQAKIDWVVEERCAELVSSHPEVSRAVVINSRKWRQMPAMWREIRQTTYDVAFDFQGNVKSGLVLAAARARQKVGFGRKTVAEWPNLFFTNLRFDPPPGRNIRHDYLFLVQRVFKDEIIECEEVSLKCSNFPTLSSAGKQRILVCPGAAWPNKELTLGALEKCLERYRDSALFFSWGTQREKERAEALQPQFAGSVVLERLSLPALQQVMRQVDLVIAMDSLPLHLCATTATPTLSFFGPSSGAKYAPLGSRHSWTQGTCPYGIEFEKRCPKLRTCKTGACMKGRH